MSFRPSPWTRRAAAGLVLLLGLALALAGPVRGPVDRGPDPAAVAAPAGAARPTADRGPGPGLGVAASGGERGPSCDPGGHGQGQGAGVLPRSGGQEHAQLAAGRYAPGQVRPHAPSRARVHVRGPDQRAPKPVELSVMRV
ncbi:hypothetical protein ACQKM2_06535 [Streptomyces sp. NPDC004126]|uniref:hypothetical protein n=1 Tax=Streptomyces sp. NPDC004126 TaxID=3390695 RepID=UPI003D04F484